MAVKSPIVSALAFKNIANLMQLSGTYTPNNDYLYLYQNIPEEKRPNFFLMICSGQINVTISSAQSYLVAALPILKQCFFALPSDFPINGIYIEGRQSMSPIPMVQGAHVDYFCLMGQATIS